MNPPPLDNDVPMGPPPLPAPVASSSSHKSRDSQDLSVKYKKLKRKFFELEEKHKETSTELQRSGERNVKMREERNILLDRIIELESQTHAASSGSPPPSGPGPQIAQPSSSALPRTLLDARARTSFIANLRQAIAEDDADDDVDPILTSRHVGPQARKREEEEARRRQEEEARELKRASKKARTSVKGKERSNSSHSTQPPSSPQASSSHRVSTPPLLVSSAGTKKRAKRAAPHSPHSEHIPSPDLQPSASSRTAHQPSPPPPVLSHSPERAHSIPPPEYPDQSREHRSAAPESSSVDHQPETSPMSPLPSHIPEHHHDDSRPKSASASPSRKRSANKRDFDSMTREDEEETSPVKNDGKNDGELERLHQEHGLSVGSDGDGMDTIPTAQQNAAEPPTPPRREKARTRRTTRSSAAAHSLNGNAMDIDRASSPHPPIRRSGRTTRASAAAAATAVPALGATNESAPEPPVTTSSTSKKDHSQPATSAATSQPVKALSPPAESTSTPSPIPQMQEEEDTQMEDVTIQSRSPLPQQQDLIPALDPAPPSPILPSPSLAPTSAPAASDDKTVAPSPPPTVDPAPQPPPTDVSDLPSNPPPPSGEEAIAPNVVEIEDNDKEDIAKEFGKEHSPLIESILRLAEAAIAAQNAAAGKANGETNSLTDPNLDPALMGQDGQPPTNRTSASPAPATAGNTPPVPTSDSSGKASTSTPPPSTTNTSASQKSFNPYSAYYGPASTNASGHPPPYPSYNPYYYLAAPLHPPYGPPHGYAPPPPHPHPPAAAGASPPPALGQPPGQSPLQPSMQRTAPTTTDVQRAAKPKRLKAHTVTSKSFSIPMVPRDKRGKPMLPLNVGIMTVINLGTVCMREHFHTERYIFPVGYEVTRRYLSTLDPNTEVVYHCTILDGGDGPKFQIIPADCPNRPVIAGTATGAWSSIVKQANAIRNRQHSNSVSGPDFFGLGQNTIKHLIQELPNADKLRDYVWQNFVEGGPLGGRHAAVIPALPEEYDAVSPLGSYYIDKAKREAAISPGPSKGLSYYPPHVTAQAQKQQAPSTDQPSGAQSEHAQLPSGHHVQQSQASTGTLNIQEYQPPNGEYRWDAWVNL
ncbi:hypothetical protein AX16_004615 [Volvariella volvacea WC 439]|nr:hypothetical protein AX16_004615 [Volvariella volvacea WC 439]